MPLVPCGQMILDWKLLQTHILKYDKLKYKKERRGGEEQDPDILSSGGGRALRACC
jgi:hypothetical protein